MREGSSPEDATLLDVLIDGFEKNEILGGFHWRNLPMHDETAAARKFTALTDEATRWKGQRTRLAAAGPRRMSAWPDLEIRQFGRGLMVRARALWFQGWHEDATWAGDPMGSHLRLAGRGTWCDVGDELAHGARITTSTESPDELAEIKRRAVDALSGRNPSYSREDSVARARAVVEAIRSRKP